MRTLQSLGGEAAGKLSRARSLARYYANPNKCEECEAVIDVPDNVRVAVIRMKRFCNRQCAAKYNNRVYPKRQPQGQCAICQTPIRSFRTYCTGCKKNLKKLPFIEKQTKGDLFQSRSNWQSARSSIRNHASQVFAASGQPMTCHICGYAKHVQIAHRKSVSSFPDVALITEINRLTNLIALCPNHHWEFDHDALSII